MNETSSESYEPTMGACQRYLKSLRVEEKEKSTKAIDREPLRGRRTNTMKWKIRTPEMTDEEYQIAIKKHRAKLSKIWRQKNKGYHTEYAKHYRKNNKDE